MALLQAREAAMLFFRPSLNRHGLTEQQWRVIRILHRQGAMESRMLAEHACILKPSMTGVLNRMERDGLVFRRKAVHDQRRVFVELTAKGHGCFESMRDEVEADYRRLQELFSEEKMNELLRLLNELRSVQI
ncbi:MAG: homoprotocatechuate degradation operon regulator HpaR [Lautropia sp.]|nr:homoprotocatechuate degradation operon regulator HpaR [Lautropia sp.]